ncbi:maternal protein tudor isoform X2 [Copidosoma floridanum]|uniref:maternal protein tudor isoform X2 n=1 Tax=Copidosoma floridanum TaxID=29053 RepID=UPI000C6F555E|nr:maternal protein tudor isoform X2 [Copidosoma floridanum]
MIIEDKPFPFLVTHVEADGLFLKIWAQTDESIVQSVNAILNEIQDQLGYAISGVNSLSSFPPNTRCCARRSNSSEYYHRAKVIGIRSDGMLKLHFIDYGIVNFAPLNSVRLLDGISEANYLFSLPDAASPFILGEVGPINNHWHEDVVSAINSILVSNQYVGTYRTVGLYRVIRFNAFGDDFSKVLVRKNMALYNPFTPQSVQSPIPAQSVRQSHPVKENWRTPAPQISAASTVSPTAMPIQKIIKTNAFKAIQLEINSVHDVKVSYVENGPCKFSVQLLSSIRYLDAMMTKINSQHHLPLQEPPIAGAVCLGKQSQTNRLCRVVLNSPGDTSCKVYFADYGHHEVLPYSNIYHIPDEFAVPNVFSIRFTLSGITNWTVSEEMKDYFAGLVSDENLTLVVCKGPMSPLTQYCDLFLKGKCIRDILCQNFPDQCRTTYRDPKNLQKGSTENVFVTYVIDPTKFFVQLESDAKLLDEVLDQIERYARTAENISPSQIYNGMPCIALYDGDHRWYRASVLELVQNNRIKVFYVDFGNEEIVSISSLRAISKHLIDILSKQAIRCCLCGIHTQLVNQELVKNFKAVVLEEHLSMTIQDIVSGVVLVHLHDRINAPGTTGKNIHKRLEEFKAIAMQSQTCTISQSRTENDNRSKNIENYESATSATHKENGNEELYRNRSDSGYGNDLQKNRFDKEVNNKSERFGQVSNRYGRSGDIQDVPNHRPKDYGANDQSNRGLASNNFNSGRPAKENQSNKPNLSARFDRNITSDKNESDKDSDTSSRSGSRRNSRPQNRNVPDEQRKRFTSGRWENEEDTTSNINHSNDENTSITDIKLMNDSSKMPTAVIPRQLTSTPFSKIPPPNITVGAVKSCELVHYCDPSNFYVQLCPDNEDLHEMSDKIQAAYRNSDKALPSSEIKVDLQCIAQYSKDKLWYRAIVRSVDSRSVATVHFVDYGNAEAVGFDKIRQIEAEFLKLPAQAVHCRLFCPSKSEWSSEESYTLECELDDKPFEAEFVKEDNGIYEIYIKELKSIQHLNDLFSKSLNTKDETEPTRGKGRDAGADLKLVIPKYAALNEKWLNNKLDVGKKYDVFLAWYINPENFYCHLESQQKEFRNMMKNIQDFYAHAQPVQQPLEVGSSIIAILPDDGVLYRAEILEINKPRGHVVQYIDYGDKGLVDPKKIYPVDQRFRTLPRQAIFCSLKNIAPPSGFEWTDRAEIRQIFSSEKFECIFHELKNEKHFISLTANNVDVAGALVEKNLAKFSPTISNEIINVVKDNVKKQELPRIDIHLLEGQTLFVRVSNVEGVSKFYVQFYTAETCQSFVNDFMTENDPKVMPHLLSHEVCIGAGCLIFYKGKWRRSVVIKCNKSNYEVRFIDTGEHEKCALHSMLGLPGQLALMQNQAIECRLFDVPLSSKADDLLKKTVTGKDVKIFVEKVEFNGLVVRLFDLNGDKIKVHDSQNTEKINPVCSMQILTSTQEVSVNYIKNSSSVWLQREADIAADQRLLDDMYEYYSKMENEQSTEIAVKENEMYAALSIDLNWYRVKVNSLKEIEKMASVTLIDYGNTEDLALSNFRKLDKRFYLPHQLAVEVSLTVKIQGTDEEQRKILDPFFGTNKVFLATFYNVNRKWVVELSEDGKKVSEQLVSLKVVEHGPKVPQFEELHKHLPDMRVGERYKVFVTHVDNPSQLWLHRDEDIDSLDEMQRQLQEYAAVIVDKSDGSTVPHLEEKSLCLALYTFDNQWYRAEVIDVAPEEIVTVRFIDYGNTDVINHSGKCLLPLSEKWKSIRRYAIPCKLDLLPVNAADCWSEEACKKTSGLLLDDKLMDKPIETLIISDKAPMRIDIFLPDEQSICKTLIDAKLAVSCESESLPKVSTGGPVAQDGDEEDEEVQLDPRSAFTSSIVSVDEFWMQEEKLVNDLERMEDRLMMATMFPSLTEIKEGLLCVAKFSVDGLYYRATILSHEDAGTRVRYIDYGNTAFSDDLRIIPDDLAKFCPLARKCRLAKPDGVENWPNNIDKKFIQLSDEGATIFLLDVIEEGETCLVKLTLDSKDVALELIKLCAEAHQVEDEVVAVKEDVTVTATSVPANETTEERLSPIGQENSVANDICIITHIISPSEFWIQKTKHFPQIDGIAEKMENFESFAVVSKIEKGKILAAKFDVDNLWYRSKVLMQNENGTEVLYIDYGNSAVIESRSDLRELPEELAQLPALATCCCLKLTADFEEWPMAACNKLKEFSLEETELQLKFLSSVNQPGPIEVSLLIENQDITEILLSAEILNTELIHGAVDKSSKYSDEKNLSNDSAITSEGQTAKTINNFSSTISSTTTDSSSCTTSAVAVSQHLKDSVNSNLTRDSAVDSDNLHVTPEIYGDLINSNSEYVL